MKNVSNLRALINYLSLHQERIYRATTFSVLNKIFDILPEFLIAVAIDTVINQGDSWLSYLGIASRELQIAFLGMATFLVWCLESLFEYLKTIQWRGIAQRVQHELRLSTYRLTSELPIEHVEKMRAGNLLTILGEDINHLEHFLDVVADRLIQLIASSVIIGLMFFLIAPSVTAAAIIPIPLILLSAFYFQKKLTPYFANIRSCASELTNAISNNLSGMTTILSLGNTEIEYQKIERLSEQYQKATKEGVKRSALVTPVVRIAVLIGFLGTLIIGAHEVFAGNLSIASYSLLIFWTQRLLWPLTGLAQITVSYQEAMACAGRVLALHQLKTDHPISEGKISTPENAAIVFDGVYFSYEDQSPLLHDIHLQLSANESYAIVGPSGSGKSTLTKLILGFYAPKLGTLKFGDTLINELNMDIHRHQIGYIDQMPFLSYGTILENILAGSEHQPNELARAIRMAHADFIYQLPEGLNTLIHDHSSGLSGGERQRIALARAIYRQPRLFIMDEVTSATDSHTTQLITESIRELREQSRVILITHNMPLARTFENIIVIKDGRIEDTGSHDQLLNSSRTYQQLCAGSNGI